MQFMGIFTGILTAIIIISVVVSAAYDNIDIHIRSMHINHLWALVAGVAIQFVFFTPIVNYIQFGDAHTFQHVTGFVHVITLMLFLFTTFSNMHYSGVWVIAVGLLLNAIVVMTNGGYMPVDLDAMQKISPDIIYQNGDILPGTRSIYLENPFLYSLSDIILVDLRKYIHYWYVISVGDILVYLGTIWTILFNGVFVIYGRKTN